MRKKDSFTERIEELSWKNLANMSRMDEYVSSDHLDSVKTPRPLTPTPTATATATKASTEETEESPSS